MRKFLPVVFCGMAAISYSQLTLAGGEGKRDSGAGPTDNPNVTRDAHGREHVNKGKHTGQMKKDEKESAGSGSTSAPGTSSSSSSTTSSDPAVTSDSSAGARKGDASVGGTEKDKN